MSGKIVTEAFNVQDSDDYYDIDCEAWYEGKDQLWVRRVWLDKRDDKICECDKTLFSGYVTEPLREVSDEEVPEEVKNALSGRVESAKDSLEDIRQKR